MMRSQTLSAHGALNPVLGQGASLSAPPPRTPTMQGSRAAGREAYGRRAKTQGIKYQIAFVWFKKGQLPVPAYQTDRDNYSHAAPSYAGGDSRIRKSI
jgi:hypothetical protein